MHETKFSPKGPLVQRKLLFTFLAMMAMPPLLASPYPFEADTSVPIPAASVLLEPQLHPVMPGHVQELERNNSETLVAMLSDDGDEETNGSTLTRGEFRWAVELGEGGELILSGNVPSEGLKNFLYLRAGGQALDNTSAMEGAPERFAGVAVASIQALKGILSGRIVYEDGSWSFTGLANDEDQRRQMLGELRQNVSLSGWNIDIELLPPFQVCLRSVEAFSLTQTIFFAPASAELTEPSSETVMGLAQQLKACPSAKVYVEGHTDADGPEDGNMTLSVKRAEAVVKELIAAGVSDMRLYAVGYGETLPVANNETRIGRALNRRIVFQLEE